MRRLSPRWCGALLLGLVLVLEPACSDPVPHPAGTDAGTEGDAGTDPDGGGSASRKPHVLFVVDRSSTMIWPLDRANPGCRMSDGTVCGTQGQDNCNPTRCPTRLGLVKTELEMFMSSHATSARYGLAFFPATTAGSSSVEELCRASSGLSVLPPGGDAPELLQAAADAVLRAVRDVPTPAGSSPLADTLKMVERVTPLGTSAAMSGDVVVLLTDGVPNCNASNVYDGTQAECRCTLGAGMCTGDYARRGCIDQQGPAEVMTALRARGVRTYVLPVGQDALTGEGASVFNALAEAGGTARDCPQGKDAECGGSLTCHPTTRQCSWRFLLPEQLGRILEQP